MDDAFFKMIHSFGGSMDDTFVSGGGNDTFCGRHG